VKKELLEKVKANPQNEQAEIENQREWVGELKKQCASSRSADARELASVADYLIRRSVWIFGGDGWAYDIGYGGLDHVLASGRNVNVLVLDTEVYSNTCGQCPRRLHRAIAKFAASGSHRQERPGNDGHEQRGRVLAKWPWATTDRRPSRPS
jgi:pyruvate-ferredoxin/flavodoxin oxidoreductase